MPRVRRPDVLVRVERWTTTTQPGDLNAYIAAFILGAALVLSILLIAS